MLHKSEPNFVCMQGICNWSTRPSAPIMGASDNTHANGQPHDGQAQHGEHDHHAHHSHLPHLVRTSVALATEAASNLAPDLLSAAHALHAPNTTPAADHEAEESDYQQMISAAIQKANRNRHSLEVVLPKQAPGHFNADGTAVKAGKDGAAGEDAHVAVGLTDLDRTSKQLGRQLLLDHAMCTQDQDNTELLMRIKNRMEA